MSWTHSGGRTQPTNYNLDLLTGKLGGKRSETVFGLNPQVGTVEEDIWDPGGALVYPVQPGETWEVVSSDTNDTSSGTGARTVFVSFVDKDYVNQNETLTLNGTTPVVMTATDAFRFRNAIVLTVGSGNENAGNITFRPQGGGNVRGQINGGDVNSLNGHFTVPAGETAFLVFAFSNINKNEDIQLAVKATIGDGGVFSQRFLLSLFQEAFSTKLAVPLAFGEKSDLKIVGVSSDVAGIGSMALQFMVQENF